MGDPPTSPPVPQQVEMFFFLVEYHKYTNFGSIAMKLGSDIHRPQRMNFNNSSDHPSFPLAPA